jgi:hypothetical protein
MQPDKRTSHFPSLSKNQQRRGILTQIVSGHYVQAEILRWHIAQYAQSSGQSYERASAELKVLARQALEIKLSAF